MIYRTDYKRGLVSMTSTREALEQWDRYWAYGNLHSFSQVFDDNYRGEIANFWRARFVRLPAGAHVVDIATGNGAIALLALRESDRLGRSFKVSGVDLAAIDPAAKIKDESLRGELQRIVFHSRTSAEQLPFEDGSVDMVCSQFGIEYSDVSRSASEIARVIKPGGRLAFIVHHAGSLLLAGTRREIDHLAFVLEEARLYLRARNLLRARAESGTGRRGTKIKKKEQGLREALSRIDQEASRHVNSNMLLGPARYVREIFAASNRMSPREALGWLEEAQARVLANRRRLLDMTAAARDEEGIAELADRLVTQGLCMDEPRPVRQDDRAILGWGVEGRRPA